MTCSGQNRHVPQSTSNANTSHALIWTMLEHIHLTVFSNPSSAHKTRMAARDHHRAFLSLNKKTHLFGARVKMHRFVWVHMVSYFIFYTCLIIFIWFQSAPGIFQPVTSVTGSKLLGVACPLSRSYPDPIRLYLTLVSFQRLVSFIWVWIHDL